MIRISGPVVVMTIDEYEALVDDSKARHEMALSDEEKDVMAEALTILRTHNLLMMMGDKRINGRTLADREKIIRRMMAKITK